MFQRKNFDDINRPPLPTFNWRSPLNSARVATVVQFCGRTRALSRLRFDMIEGLNSDEPIVKYIGKHRVEQIKGITNDWYKDFLRGWKQFVQQKYGNTPYFFPTERNGEITHIEDDWLRLRFKAFMRMCGLPQLTIHSIRYIYATRLYLMGVTPDAIKDVLGVDKKTLKYYVKATEERKKKVLFKYMEKVSALPKEKKNKPRTGLFTRHFARARNVGKSLLKLHKLKSYKTTTHKKKGVCGGHRHSWSKALFKWTN